MAEVQENHHHKHHNNHQMNGGNKNTREVKSYDEESKMRTSSDDSTSRVIERDNHDRNFIKKMYEMLITTFPVQDRMKKISQPFVNIYHELLEDSINEFKDKGQEFINNTKEKLTSWIYSVNIYSHLAGLWLLQHSPFIQAKIVSQEEFLKSFMNADSSSNKGIDSELVNKTAIKFYDLVSAEWKKLEEPNTENIKYTLLLAVARTISQITLEIDDDTYANGLVDTFKEIVEQRHTLVSNEDYLQVMQQEFTDMEIEESKFKKGTLDFYIYAKRFTLIDLPMVVHTTTSISEVIVNFVQNLPRTYASKILTGFEKYLDMAIMKLSEKPVKEKHETILTLKDRVRSITNKVMKVMTLGLDKSLEYTQSTKLYITTDPYIDYKQRYNDITFMVLSSYDIFKNKIYQPTTKYLLNTKDKLRTEYQTKLYEPICAYYNDTTKKYTVLLKNLAVDLDILSTRLPTIISNGYEHLKKATITLKNNILELKFDKETIDEYRIQITNQIEKLYHELSEMELEDVKQKVIDLYQDAIQVLKSKINRKQITGPEN